MVDKQLILNDGGTAVQSSGVSDNIIDLGILKDAFGTATTQEIKDAYLNVVVRTNGTGSGTVAIDIISDTTTPTSSDKVAPIKSAAAGTTYDAGQIVYSGVIPVPLKRYMALYFTVSGTASVYIDAWIATPLTDAETA